MSVLFFPSDNQVEPKRLQNFLSSKTEPYRSGEPMKPKILFLCIANSARSQIAEYIAKDIFGDAAEVRSAGSQPSGQVHPIALEVLADDRIDVRAAQSKSVDSLEPEFLRHLDYVITLCHDEVCPALSSDASRLHWPLPDPANARPIFQHDIFCFVKAQLRKRLTEFGVENGII